MAMGASPHFMLSDSSSMISKVELLLPEEKSFHLELIVLHCPHSPHFTAYSLVQFIPVLSNSVQASISYGHFWVHFFSSLSTPKSKPCQTSSLDASRLLSYDHIFPRGSAFSTLPPARQGSS